MTVDESDVEPFRCEVEPDRATVRVRPIGELDLATVPLVGAELAELWSVGFTRLVVDLRAVTFLDTNPILNGRTPGYHDIVPLPDGRLVRTRQTDGLHLCAPGAALLGQVVSDDIAARFKATVAPAWQQGPWTTDKVYPAASCPAP